MSRRRSALSKKTRNLHGLNPRTFPLSVRSFVDFDYVHTLSEADKLWLSAFSDGYFGADFRDDPLDTPQHLRRETYRAKNGANKDIFSYAQGWGLLDNDTDVLGEEADITPSPAVYNSPRYKAALAQYREAIDTKPKDEKLIARAQKALTKAAKE